MSAIQENPQLFESPQDFSLVVTHRGVITKVVKSNALYGDLNDTYKTSNFLLFVAKESPSGLESGLENTLPTFTGLADNTILLGDIIYSFAWLRFSIYTGHQYQLEN